MTKATSRLLQLDQDAESAILELEAQSRERHTGNSAQRKAFETSKPTLNDVLPPAKPHFLDLPEKGYQLATECSDARAHVRDFSFKPIPPS